MSIYLTFGSGSYIEAARALLICLENKVDLCASHGVHIKPEDWAVAHLCNQLVADKGELDSWKSTPIVSDLGISMAMTRSRRPDGKGTIEALMKVINFLLFRRLPGKTSGLRERCEIDPRVTAVIDFDQANRLLHELVILWNKRIRKRQAISTSMLRENVLPVPNEIWSWADRSGYLRTGNIDDTRAKLLPWHEVSMTERGIELQGLTYSLPTDGETNLTGLDSYEILAQARKTRWKVPVAVDPKIIDHIWYRHCLRGKAPKLVRCNLAPGQEGFRGLTWNEYKEIKNGRSKSVAEYISEIYLPAMQYFNAVVADEIKKGTQITNDLRAGLSKSKQTRNVTQNRKAEIQETNQATGQTTESYDLYKTASNADYWAFSNQ